ncbi:MAG: hypothetical protein H0W68_12190, partial [Gemmatimonadaceae bacterium]|nr:hypothetical protein [Gemmatimonadaceae bacterium]
MIALLPTMFSIVVDPARLMRSRDEERAIARALMAGHDVTDFTNYDDRSIQQELARVRTSAPDVLVLGSSRAQTVTHAAFPQAQSFVNGSVTAGTRDDLLALYTPYDESARRPRRLVLELDPWMLRESDPDAGWARLSRERDTMLGRLGYRHSLARDRVSVAIRIARLLKSPEYFRLALASFRRHGLAGVAFVVTDEPQNAERTMTPDGSVTWLRESRGRGDTLALQYVQSRLASDVRFTDLDGGSSARAEAVLERFVQHVIASGTGVTVLLAPYHPLTWAALRPRTPSPLVESERRFRALASRTSAAVIGSYDPALCDVTS